MNFSIIICTYNADERLLKRCLNAVAALEVDGFLSEVILIDNNSTVPLSSRDYVQDFLKCNPGSTLLLVKDQGLFYARRAGILAAKGKEIVFFDDDNAPEVDYIQALHKLLVLYPHVAAWGPGNIAVDFVDGVDKRLEACAKEAFQERREQHMAYANLRFWQSCYPFGTGLCVEKIYLDKYLSLVNQGKFTLTGRSSGQLSSGEDTQMVLHCIQQGAAAGVCPSLKLVHMVPGKRATLDYLKRLTYGASVCYSTCMAEVFPGYTDGLNLIKERKLSIKVLRTYLSLLLNLNPESILKLVDYAGAVCGQYIVLKRSVPPVVNWVLKKMNVI